MKTTLSLLTLVLLSGCASTLTQEYQGENGKSIKISVVDATPFSNNIANTMATYENSVDPRTGVQSLKISIGAVRSVDRSAEARLAEMALGAVGAYLGAQTMGPIGAAAGGAAGVAAGRVIAPTHEPPPPRSVDFE